MMNRRVVAGGSELRTGESELRRFAGWLVAARWPLLGLAIAIAALSYFPSRALKYDRSIENMFPPGDPLLPPYRRLKDNFGGNEIVMAVYRDEHLFEPDGSGFRRARKFSRALKKVDGVAAVLGPGEVDLKVPRGLNADTDVAFAFRQVFSSYTHNHEGDVTAVVCMLEPTSDKRRDARAIVDDLRRIAAQQKGGMVAGEPVMLVDGFRYVEEDGVRLSIWSTVLLGAVILFCFRSLRWLIIPLAVVHLALMMTRASLALAGMQLSMVSSMLTAIVTVVAVATVVHLIVRFRQARREGWQPREAFIRAAHVLIAPIFWACATDAVGFLALTRASAGPVQDFGWMMAAGSFLVLPAMALVTPGLALLGTWDADPATAWGEGRLTTALDALANIVRKYPWRLGGVMLLLAGVMLSGLAMIEVETDFTRNFRSGSPVVKSYEFVEANLGGAGVWDIVIPAPAVITPEYAGKVRKLEERLQALDAPGPDGKMRPALTKIISLIDGGDAVYYVPGGRFLSVERRISLLAEFFPEFCKALHRKTSDGKGNLLRIMLRARERENAAVKLAIIEDVKRIAREAFPPVPGDSKQAVITGKYPAVRGAEVTGFYVMLANIIRGIIADQWITFAWAIAGAGLMMVVAFRSIRLALVALAPNTLPVLMVLGGLGWLGVPMNMGAAMIAAVSMGLSVDSSIHYIYAFSRARRRRCSVAESIEQAQQTVGRAMVFSTLALIAGFCVLCISNFIPTVYFGALVSLAMAGGLAGNLMILPLLLQITHRDKPATSEPTPQAAASE